MNAFNCHHPVRITMQAVVSSDPLFPSLCVPLFVNQWRGQIEELFATDRMKGEVVALRAVQEDIPPSEFRKIRSVDGETRCATLDSGCACV